MLGANSFQNVKKNLFAWAKINGQAVVVRGSTENIKRAMTTTKPVV